MDKLKQFIYTATKRGFAMWGTSENLPLPISDYTENLYNTYKEDKNARNEFIRAENANPNDYFPIRRKYSKSSLGNMAVQFNNLGYELYNKKRLGNVFLHGYFVEQADKSLINCFLEEGFFHQCLNEEEAQQPKSNEPLDAVYIPDVSCEQAIDELCNLVNSEAKQKRLAVFLDLVLKIINNDNEHLVFLNTKMGNELWELIKSSALLLPEELVSNLTFDTMFYPTARDICRKFDFLSARDKIIGLYDDDKRLIDEARESENNYTILNMDVESFGKEPDEVVYKFIKKLFGDPENTRNALKLYFRYLSKASGEGFEKMKHALSKIIQKHKQLPYISFSDICKLLLENSSMAREYSKIIYDALNKKLEDGAMALIDSADEIREGFTSMSSLVDTALIKIACEGELLYEHVKATFDGDKESYNVLNKLVKQLGYDSEFAALLEDVIDESFSAYTQKIAKALLTGDDFADKQMGLVKKFAKGSIPELSKEFPALLDGEIDRIINQFIEGNPNYYQIINVVNAYYDDGMRAIQGGISRYIQANSTEIARMLIKEDEKTKELYDRLSENDKGMVLSAIEEYFQSEKSALADGIINNNNEAKQELKIFESYINGIANQIKGAVLDNVSNHSGEYAQKILDGNNDIRALYDSFGEMEKDVIDIAIVNIINAGAQGKIQSLFEGNYECLAMFKIACDITSRAKLAIVKNIESYTEANRVKIANGLISEDEKTEKAFDALMEYTDSIKQTVAQAIYRFFDANKDKHVLSFSQNGYKAIDRFVNKSSRICPEIQKLFNDRLQEHYFGGDFGKSTVKAYIIGADEERFDIIKKRIPSFASLASDIAYELYNDELGSLCEQVYSGNADSALDMINAYYNVCPEIDKNELYRRLMKQFDNNSAWTSVLKSNIKLVNAIKALKATPYITQLRDSFHKYLLSKDARANINTINDAIKIVNQLGISAIVSTSELYEIVNGYDKSLMDGYILDFITSYIDVSDNSSNALNNTSDTAYQMLFEKSLGSTTTIEQIINVIKKYPKIDVLDSIVEVVKIKKDLSKEDYSQLFDGVLEGRAYNEALDTLLTKNIDVAKIYFEFYMNERLAGNVLLEVIKSCNSDISPVIKNTSIITKLIQGIEEEDRVATFTELLNLFDESTRIQFLKQYLNLYSLRDFTNKHTKSLSKLFTQKSVYINLLNTYLGLFGKYRKLDSALERVVRDVSNEECKSLEGKLKENREKRYRYGVVFSIINQIINDEISFDHIEYLQEEFGKDFTAYLLLCFAIDVDIKAVEKRLNQLIDYSKKKDILTADDLKFIYEYDSKLCERIATPLGAYPQTITKSMDGDIKTNLLTKINNIILYGKELSAEGVNSIVSYFENKALSENIYRLTRTLLRLSNLSSLPKETVDKLVKLTAQFEKTNGFCNANLSVLYDIKDKKLPNEKYISILSESTNDEKLERVKINTAYHITQLGLDRKYDEKMSNYLYRCYGKSYLQAVYDSATATITTKDCLRGLEKAMQILYNESKQLYRKLIYNIECIDSLGNKKLSKILTKSKN